MSKAAAFILALIFHVAFAPHASGQKEGWRNLLPVLLKGKWGFIDWTGKIVIEPKFDAFQYFATRARVTGCSSSRSATSGVTPTRPGRSRFRRSSLRRVSSGTVWRRSKWAVSGAISTAQESSSSRRSSPKPAPLTTG